LSSPAVLSLDELCLPVPGPVPSGDPLADGVRLQLDDLRKEADDFDSSTAGRVADWPKVIRIATENLQTKSKDLLLAVRLVEGVTKKHGWAGLRDGLQLLGRLSAECWDYLHPMPGPGEDAEIRVGPFNWLNDSMRGAKFPQVIGNLPVAKAGGKPFAYVDWIVASRKEELEGVIGKVDAAALKATFEEIGAARAALEELSRTLDEKLGADIAPNFLSPENTSSMGTAIDQCLEMVHEVAKRRGVQLEPGAAGESDGDTEGAEEASAGSLGGSSSVGSNRDELYRQLGQIAATLKRIEPHSPVPFMIERCVKLGTMPFPSLMRAIIRESGTLDELDRIMGLEQSQAPSDD
jgi:type VI secretion system protein ImpA